MRNRCAVAVVLGTVVLGGCALPQLSSPDHLRVADVIDAVECELKDAMIDLSPRYPFLKKWGVGVGLSLIADENGSFSPDVSKIFLTNFGMFTLGAHADFSARAKRTVNFKVAFAFSDLEKFQCPGRPPGSLHPLASRLGIHEWLARSLAAIDKEDVVGDPLSIGTTIQFVLTYGGKLSPQFSLVQSRTTPSAVFGASRSDDHTLDLALAPLPKPPPPPKPVEVIIVGKRP